MTNFSRTNFPPIIMTPEEIEQPEEESLDLVCCL